MKIFDGKKEAEKILAQLKKKAKQNEGPKLAVIAVAPDFASRLYMANKRKAAKKVGIKVTYYGLAKENEVLGKIEKLNKDSSVHGIIVQLPLPKKFNVDKIINAIDPAKDVDGFQQGSLLSPVLPAAILLALKRSNKKIKNVAAFVNSDKFGKTLKDFLAKEGIRVNYFFKDSIAKVPAADVLISVCGCPGIVKSAMIKKGAVLIDAGITMANGKLLGDVDQESVGQKPSFLTPVPGGIGPLTVALLLKNVYLAYGNSKINRPHES